MLLNYDTCWTDGNHGGVVWVPEIVVAVMDNDRRVLQIPVAEEGGGVGLRTCVWSWVYHSARHPTPAGGLAKVFLQASSQRCSRR